MQSLSCGGCGAALLFEADHRTTRCPYCASPQVIARPATADRPNPSFVLPFALRPERARALARRWIDGARWAPAAFRRATVEDLVGLYVPAWAYSTAAHSRYSARIGERYTVTETKMRIGSDGKPVMETKTRVETEWCPLEGEHATWVDRLVTASRGVPNDALEAIEPFDLAALRRYTPKLVSGWAAEEPSVRRAQGLELGRAEARLEVRESLASFMPGDTHEKLGAETRFELEELALLLLPIWVLAVRWAEDQPVVRLLVNGQTGAIHGEPPRSRAKIALAVGLGLAVLVGLGLWLSGALEAAR